MKLNESDRKCDFCGFYEPKYEINDGLWWLCLACYANVYECRCTEDLQFHHPGYCEFNKGGEEE